MRRHRRRGAGRALNPIGAQPGQKVVVESSTKKMLHIIMLVYLTPIVLFWWDISPPSPSPVWRCAMGWQRPASFWEFSLPWPMTGVCAGREG